MIITTGQICLVVEGYGRAAIILVGSDLQNVVPRPFEPEPTNLVVKSSWRQAFFVHPCSISICHIVHRIRESCCGLSEVVRAVLLACNKRGTSTEQTLFSLLL